MLEIMALATGVLVSFGAATVGSWAILEAVLRLAEPAASVKARRQKRRERLRHRGSPLPKGDPQS